MARPAHAGRATGLSVGYLTTMMVTVVAFE
jgi:hypothetical protein